MTTSTSSRRRPAPRRWPCCGEAPFDCVVLDLRLPDMSRLRGAGDGSATMTGWPDLPVVVFTGRELSAEEDAQLHTMARSVVVKGVESPERLLDETALFLHRVVADLPPDKQRMLERLHSSDEDLVGRTVLVVDDDARNIFALSSVLERRGMKVLTATTGREAIASHRCDDRYRHRADGHHDAGDGRLSDHAGDPREPGAPPPADHRADGQGDEGRPREVPGGRAPPTISPSRSTPSSCCRRCACGCTARPEWANMNGRRQGQHPAGRRPAGQAAELRSRSSRELGENLIKANSAQAGPRASAEDRRRRRPGRCLHARARRLRAGAHDPRAPALPEDRDHLHFGRPSDRSRPPAGAMRSGPSTMSPVPVVPGDPAGQGHGLRRALSQDPPARAAEPRAGTARRRADGRAGGIHGPAARERGAPAARLRCRPDGLVRLRPGYRPGPVVVAPGADDRASRRISGAAASRNS